MIALAFGACAKFDVSNDKHTRLRCEQVVSNTAAIHGFNRTLARTGLGLYDIITAPFPPYGPVCARNFPSEPAYPDNYKPAVMADSMFETDTVIGFSGGPIAPIVPGNRFQVLSGQ